MDDSLIQAAIKGNDDALILCLQQMSPQLVKTAMALMGDSESVKDCIAETTLHVYKSRKQIKHPEFFKTWVIRILLNQCNNELKRQNRWIALSDDFDMPAPQANDYSFVHDVLAILPNDLKEVVVLKYFHEMTFKEIAQILEMPESTAKSRCRLALAKMRVEMEEVYE